MTVLGACHIALLDGEFPCMDGVPDTIQDTLGSSPRNAADLLLCGLECSRVDSLTQHKRSCKENPTVKRQVGKQIARQPTLLELATQPQAQSGGANPEVIPGVEQFGASKLPRVGPNSPIVYRGEVHCRFPDCNRQAAFCHPNGTAQDPRQRSDVSLKRGCNTTDQRIGRYMGTHPKTAYIVDV
jgi:hypothetical protein